MYQLRKFVLFDGFHRYNGLALHKAVFTMLLIAGFFAIHFASFRMGGLARRVAGAWCLLTVMGLLLVIALTPNRSPEFIYFQFWNPKIGHE